MQQGLIFLDNSTWELHPLNDRLQALYLTLNKTKTYPHIAKKSYFTSAYEDAFPIAGNLLKRNLQEQHSIEEIDNIKAMNDIENIYSFNNVDNIENVDLMKNMRNIKNLENDNEEGKNILTDITNAILSNFQGQHHQSAPPSSRPAPGGLTLEVALFFDEAAYKIFAPYMGYNDKKLQDMILAYLNGVQALYHHPSIGTSLEIVLVRLDIMKKQSPNLPHYEGERSKLLDSFCAYQSKINPGDDKDPGHWDMALYISGLDFFAYENGQKSGVTMGLATVGGVCLKQYNCIIAELGTTNVFGKPYPSAGFTSVYILAHEIGHNLGMHHDSSGNSCPKEGYVMSPSRGTNGETQWSSCSAEIMAKLSSWAKCLFDSNNVPKKNLDHNRYLDEPGRSFTAKKQCEILLRDKNAVVASNQKLDTICYNLQCKTPRRSGFYHAGPALEGTECGWGRYCRGGECTSKIPPKPLQVIPGGWGAWKDGTCSSGCIEKSLGYQNRQRQCNNPTPVNTDQGCEGSSFESALCKDEKICQKTRKSPVEYASQKCKEFSKLLPQLDSEGVGLQAPHEEGRIWMGCAIFCKRANSPSFYTPRLELNDLNVSPYFPDGTWCHYANGENYYCLQHHCLPKDFKFSKNFELDSDLPIAQNAHPKYKIPLAVEKYLSLNANGRPMKTDLKLGDAHLPKEEDWETKDYVELPFNENNYIS